MAVILFNFLGLLAGALTTASFLPQVIRIYRRRSAADISGFGASVFTIGVALWLAYGIAVHSMPITVTNAVTLALNLGILALKIRHRPKPSK